MITCGPTILRACNVVPRVQEALGQRYAGTYSGVAPHSPVETVEAGVEMAKEAQPDVFISVGGGSTHDTTKAMATLLAEGGDIRDYAIIFEPPDRITVPPTPSPKVPILSVPTTMGCAEFSSGGGGITDHRLGRKLSIAGEGVTHRTVIIDGQALATTPLRILVSTAIGQLRIAIETVYSTGHNPIGDGMALHAIRLLFENLPRCRDGDIDTLLDTKTACAMASLGSFGGLGLNTATCHHVGGLYGVPHGEANAILLPHTMRYNLDASAGRQRLIAEAIGVANRPNERRGRRAGGGRRRGRPVPGTGAAPHPAGGRRPRRRSGVHRCGDAARPEPEHQPQARHRRRPDHGGAEGGVLKTKRRPTRLPDGLFQMKAPAVPRQALAATVFYYQ